MDFATAQPEIAFKSTAEAQPEEALDAATTSQGAETPTTVSDDVMQEDPSPVEAITPGRDEEQQSLTNRNAEAIQLHQQQAPEATAEGTKTRSSQYRGVCWNKKNKRWQAAINNGGRYIYLGSFTSDKDAARAFDLAALQIRGRNTKLNFSVDTYPEEEWKNGAPPHLAEKYMSGTSRPKPAPFRPFTGTPLKKLHPTQFAAIQVPFKRQRYEEAGFGKRAFDRAEQRFLSSSYFTAAMNNPQPKIKQEFPQAATVIDHSFNKVGSQSMHLDKSSFFLQSTRFDSGSGLQPSRTISVPSITTPPFHHRTKDPFDQARDFTKGESPFHRQVTSSTTSVMEDSAEQKFGMTPVPVPMPAGPYRFHSLQSAAAAAAAMPLTVSGTSDRLPVPILQSSTDEHSLHVSSVISETVAGSDIAEAKVIVGSSRNQFGLIHRMVNNEKWNALVWDGTTMHNMGVYATEDDSQVACSSAVRLVEAIMAKKIQ